MTQQEINNPLMLKVGTILHGTYRIDSYLSSGGFGNTYVATNIEFEERVAIKEFFMKGVTQRDDNQTTVSVSNSENTNSFLGQKEKFKKEARRLRKMQNEHLVRVHDLFDENGTTYYVMDYVDGENLSERLKRTGRPMTESEVRLILPQIFDALKAVHNEGFCHLDIKPSNIMLEKGGKIKLIDFGASKQLGANGTLTTNAPTAFAQTPGYAPREQMEQNLDKIGPWTDIYALGATLYNLLTNNKPPLPTDIDDDMSEDKHNALPFPESVGGMKYLVLQMMKTNRLQRPQSIDAIISAEKAIKEEPKQTPKSTETSQTSSARDDEATIISESRTNKQKECKHPNSDYTPKHDAEKSSTASNDDNPTSTERNNDTKSRGKQIIDYVKQPFGRVSLTFMALAISVCVLIIIIPGLFYIFGEESYVQETQTLELALGDFVLSDFSSLIQIAYYSFFVISIVYLIPLVIGLGHLRPLLAKMLALTCILSIGKFVENLLIEENSLLNWVLFYGEHLLFIILGFIIISTYNGRIKKLGFVLIVYSIICSLLNLLVYQIGIGFESAIQFGCYELLVWGIDLLQVWGIWWFLSPKQSQVTIDTDFDKIENKENISNVKAIVSMAAVVFGVIFIAAYYKYKQNNGFATKEVTYSWGSGKYEGYLKNGKPEGHGIISYYDGSRFEGEFTDGETNGHGKYISSDGVTRYDGMYANGRRTQGLMTNKDGSQYNGNFKNGLPDGKGKLMSANGELMFEGDFSLGRRWNGKGKEKGKNPNGQSWEYEGDYKNGIWNGKGTITWSNGDKYEGDWKDGNRTGNGTYTFNEKRNGYGYKYVGGFLKGEFHGKGTWYYVGGGSEKCTYKNGKQIQ